jgi:hypothetical protein
MPKTKSSAGIRPLPRLINRRWPPLPPTVLKPFRPSILFCTAIKPIVANSNGTEKAAAISSRGGY